MSKIKKILAVVGILVCLTTAIIVPASAFSIPMANPDEQIYLYAPVTLDLRFESIKDDLSSSESVAYSVGVAEKEEARRSYTAVMNTTTAEQALTISNQYYAVPNGGYKGSTVYTFDHRSGSQIAHNYLDGFRLPSVWAFRTLKTGIFSPSIVLSRNDNDTPITAHYTGAFYSVKTGQKTEFDFTAETTDNRIEVFPAVLSEEYGVQGFGNYILFDYKCDISGTLLVDHYSFGYDEPTIKYTLPTNGSCARLTPFASEYGEAYVEKLVDDAIIIQNANLNFTDWLSSAFGFLDVKLFGDFSLGGLLATVIGISLVMAFLKIFAGG